MLTRRAALALIPAALATPALAQKKSTGRGALIAGAYTAEGRNPDGSGYSGMAEISQDGDAVAIAWSVGGSAYRGTGVIEGRVVTIDWGDATPIVYVLMPDGSLHGTWADGTALERLAPR